MATKIQDKVLTRLYPMADILQMKLILHDVNGNMTVHGSQSMEVPMGTAVWMEANCKVMASNISVPGANYAKEGDGVWVLVHIKGNLWVILTNYVFNNEWERHFIKWERQFVILDGSKCGLNDKSAALFKGLPFLTVLGKLAGGVVVTYSLNKDKTKWSVVNGQAAGVDKGQSGRHSKQCGDSHPAATATP